MGKKAILLIIVLLLSMSVIYAYYSTENADQMISSYQNMAEKLIGIYITMGIVFVLMFFSLAALILYRVYRGNRYYYAGLGAAATFGPDLSKYGPPSRPSFSGNMLNQGRYNKNGF